MEAKELRIGNYITHPGLQADVVKEIFAHDKKGYAVKTDGYHIAYYMENKGSELVKPIPLTEDWLIKFGFENDETTSYRWYKDDYEHHLFAIDIDDKEIRLHDDLWLSIKCEYVHQLQNLYYALTGIELTIMK